MYSVSTLCCDTALYSDLQTASVVSYQHSLLKWSSSSVNEIQSLMAGSVSVCDTAVLEYTPGLRTSVCCCIDVNSPCCWLAYCHMFCSGFQHRESSYSFFSQVFCPILFPLLCSQWAFLPIPAAGFISRYGCAKPEEGDRRISVARKVCFARRLTFIILQFPTNLGIDHVIHTTLEEIRACRLLVFKWRYHDHTLTVHILPITIIRLEKKIKERNAQCFGSPFTTLTIREWERGRRSLDCTRGIAVTTLLFVLSKEMTKRRHSTSSKENCFEL